MTKQLNETPRANRLHIGFYGKCNSGKSSLINAFANQQVSIVSDVLGTTTDPVYKSMEIMPLGACVLIDTAGFDDISELGQIRVEKTKLAAEKTDIAVILFSDENIGEEMEWYEFFKEKNTPVVCVISKADVNGAEFSTKLKAKVESLTKSAVVVASAVEKKGTEEFKQALIRAIPADFEMPSITGALAAEGDLVLLVMPQDIQAPKGRLILPQVQTLRDLLDKKCLVITVTTDKLEQALAVLAKPPKLIITDSQVFKTVYEKKPEESLLTSFSTLFAAFKGDIDYYVKSAAAINSLTENSKVLIAECCTHAPLSEDIGREKLPRLLRKRIGDKLTVDIVSGTDFPLDLSEFDLVIQCGACMFNRKYVLSRIERAREQGVAMTNYGVAIAFLSGILDKISY